MAFGDEPKPGAQQALAQLRARGIRTVMISGDNRGAAYAMARRLGLNPDAGEVMAEVLPGDKSAKVAELKAAGRVVAMVGDGLNDGPVLAGAHVSFAFGRAVPLARAQSDFVVLSERLMAISDARLKSRDTMRIVRQNLAWAGAYNVVGVPLAMAGWMPPWAAGLGMAASSLLVVANAVRLAGNSAPTPGAA